MTERENEMVEDVEKRGEKGERDKEDKWNAEGEGRSGCAGRKEAEKGERENVCVCPDIRGHDENE